MAPGQTIQEKLIQATIEGPVFGPAKAFGPDFTERQPYLQEQIAEITIRLAADIDSFIRKGYPGLPDKDIRVILGQTLPKASVFVPFLSGGELPGKENTARLVHTGSAVAAMYVANTMMDRGDTAMQAAIEQWVGKPVEGEAIAADPEVVDSRLTVLQHIETAIAGLARPEDKQAVLEQFRTVLHYEAQLRRLSDAYSALSHDRGAQAAFLDRHAGRIAVLMVRDAGFPSVTHSLYAAARWDQSELPPLSTLDSNPEIINLLETCNATARVGDEYGDALEDAGTNLAWGKFNLNLFNQYHPELVEAVCRLADITSPETLEAIQRGSQQEDLTSTVPERLGMAIVRIFFEHAKDRVLAPTPGLPEAYRTYIMRVLEISYVNTIGDTAMAADD